MTSKNQCELLSSAKRLAWNCHLLRCDDITVAEYGRSLEQALREFYSLTRESSLPTEKQTEDSNLALLSWARDVKTMDFVQLHSLNLDRKTQWRWVQDDIEIYGQCNWSKLSKFQGVPRITNGIFVYIERGDGTVFKAHLDSFIPEVVKEIKAKTKKSEKKESTFRTRCMEEYV